MNLLRHRILEIASRKPIRHGAQVHLRFSSTFRATSMASEMQAPQKVTYSSAAEERKYNGLSDMMARFHNHFKQEYKTIYETSDGSFERRGMSLSDFLDLIQGFDQHLTMHHTIEEAYIFPKLAKKIPRFSPDYADQGHVKAHRAIHDGLVKLGALVKKWRQEPSTYSPKELRECLDSFSGILFEHLDQEVEDIKGNNLKPHFSLREIENLTRGHY